ncbi:MAG: glycosyltransferase family 4 protein, partial [Candidatus Hydrogenedentes bacterium]|nr:glycosyltransferase family 4 protein [Candidatus Hydrogenedentota bacterium]
MDKLGVVFVLDEFHPTFSGHGEYLKKHMREMANLGYSFTVISRRKPGLAPTGRFENTDIVRIPDHAKYFPYICALIRALFSLRHQYDIIHLNGPVDRWGILVLVARLLRKKIVMQMVLMGSDDPETFARSYKLGRYRLRLLARMDAFTAISQPLCDKYIESGMPERKLSLIPTGMDTSVFHSVSVEEKNRLRNELGIAINAPTAVFVGTIMYRKGVDILVDAWMDVQKQCPEAQLILVGLNEFDSGHVNAESLNDYVKSIRDQVRDNDLKVVFVGLTDKVDLYLKASDVFAFPSRKEGLGNVIFEAMGCGLPCVVSPMDGVAHDTVEDGVTGFIVESTEQMARKIAELLADRNLARSMGRAGEQRARDKFDMKKIAIQYDR